MGCDIHPVIIVRIWKEFWRPVIIPDQGRNYDFFGLLAGVRGGPPLVSEPRGRHPELHDAARFLYGGHSESWLTLREMKEALPGFSGLGRCQESENLVLCKQWPSWIEDMEYAKKWHDTIMDVDAFTDDDVVVCFDFDN